MIPAQVRATYERTGSAQAHRGGEAVGMIDKDVLINLRREIKHLNEVLREKNLSLDALHYVWCDGGCHDGTHRWTDGDITEELVLSAEENTRRLRRRYENIQLRKKFVSEGKIPE